MVVRRKNQDAPQNIKRGLGRFMNCASFRHASLLIPHFFEKRFTKKKACIPAYFSYPKAGTPETLIVSDPPVMYSLLFYHMKSTKVTGNVADGSFFLRILENLSGFTVFHHFAKIEEGCLVSDTLCLLHVMGDHDDRVAFLELHG